MRLRATESVAAEADKLLPQVIIGLGPLPGIARYGFRILCSAKGCRASEEVLTTKRGLRQPRELRRAAENLVKRGWSIKDGWPLCPRCGQWVESR